MFRTTESEIRVVIYSCLLAIQQKRTGFAKSLTRVTVSCSSGCHIVTNGWRLNRSVSVSHISPF